MKSGKRGRPTRVYYLNELWASNAEIWAECFGRRPDELKPSDSYAIAALMTRVSGWERSKGRKHIPIYGEQRFYSKVVVKEKA